MAKTVAPSGAYFLGGAFAIAIAAIACDVKLPGQEDKPPAPVETPAEPPAPTPPTVAPPEPKIDPKTGTTPEVAPLSADARTQDERNSIDVFQAAAPATVFVTQTAIVRDRFSFRAAEVPAGAGSGFVWDDKGHVVTNCHVALRDCVRRLAGASLSVTLYDQKQYAATIVGIDPYHDIAVLKIDVKGAKLVPIRRPGSDYKLEVGQKTVAIGNPFGLDHTLTVGVVSALGREVKGIGEVTIRGMVQTDAAINPGNSGGPLLDSRGQLLGMNTMIFSTSGSAAGIGFAVPVTTIERVVPQIIETGFPERVGIGIVPVDDDMAARIGVEGVIVQQVTPGSPADKAGLRSAEDSPGGPKFDVIVGIGDKRIRTFDDLYGALEEKKEGDVVKVSVRRVPGDEVITSEVALVKLETR
jgi:S1-C subfamily serine protease